MSLTKLESALTTELTNIAVNRPLKGQEKVITAIKPATNGLGPRYCLAGHGNKEFLLMNSNSYLGLSLHPKVIKAEEDAARLFGCGPGAVRFISGTFQPHIELENQLADFHNRSAAMLFSAAYASVLGTLSPLISKQTIVISDALNHNSIINALRLSRPAHKAIYSHLDLTELSRLLQSLCDKGNRVLIITDGIFSMRGDHAPLNEIATICQEYQQDYKEGVTLVVDDSHGVGACGLTGRGTEELSSGRADILIGTLGKAFGVNGGYVAASEKVISYLRETAPMYIYSNPITPAEAAAAIASLNIIDSQEGLDLLQSIRFNATKLREGLTAQDFETIEGSHPITPLMVRNTNKTTSLINHLFNNNILATGLNFPVVPKGAEEIRFQVSANHTRKDIDYLLSVLKKEPSSPNKQ